MLDHEILLKAEEIIGCKWMIRIIHFLRCGKKRPSEILEAIPGITTKVMNQRFAKLKKIGIIEKKEFRESSPHVEYLFTALGSQLADKLYVLEKFISKNCHQ
ncbi:MAG: winged helix-turn-helix transcriptional regulator [Candidatus Omnitrophica bacterium]|nr:winged helix-turn-helix transcriptional regulator [Candidatus Omnitrophota bacterium]